LDGDGILLGPIKGDGCSTPLIMIG
jgi:hypothetical protein